MQRNIWQNPDRIIEETIRIPISFRWWVSGFPIQMGNGPNSKEDGILVDDILVVDKLAEMFVLGCTIDYVKEFGGSYLKVVNPNATAAMWVWRKFCSIKYLQ